MTPKQLQTLLDRAGLSQRGTAKLIGIGERTMRGYVSGEHPIPRTVEYAVRWVIFAAPKHRFRSQNRRTEDFMSDDRPVLELNGIPKEMMEGFMSSCIINLIRALPDQKFTMNLGEFERQGIAHIWGYTVDMSASPTGELHIDARIAGKITLEVIRRQ